MELKNALYRYTSPVGTFIITRDEIHYSLFFNDELQYTASDPNHLAMLVFSFSLSNPNWDTYQNEIEDVPPSLHFWESLT